MTKTIFSEVSIPSKYQGLPIKIRSSKTHGASKTILVLHPGAFEFLGGDNDRYTKILLWLHAHLSARPTVITYETSRKSMPTPTLALPDPLYWQKKETYWRKVFAGKIFDQELDDVRKVYEYIQRNLHPEHIYVLGFSVGGTIALILSQEIPLITKLCLMGSAISTRRPYLPVLTGYPTKKWILKRITNYPNAIKIVQGMRDTIVPFKDAEEVFRSLRSASYASFDRLADADHMFSGTNAYNLFDYLKILTLLQNFYNGSI